MDVSKEDSAEEIPRATNPGPGDPSESAPEAADEAVPEVPEPDAEVIPELRPPKPGIYMLRPRGLRPAPRPARRRRGRLRNDCPPDRRRESGRPPLKPRLR